jgi:FkbM family methyltransferase
MKFSVLRFAVSCKHLTEMLLTGAVWQRFENWKAVVRLYLPTGCGAEQVTLRLRSGGSIIVRSASNDAWAVHEIFLRNDYKLSSFSLGNSPLIVDIGGNIGLFAICALQRWPASRILTFEPEPSNFKLLRTNIEKNCFQDRVTAVEMAVSAEQATVSLHLSPSNVGGHSLVASHQSTRKLAVAATTLTDILQRSGQDRIDLLKLDCEGSEFPILYNCPGRTLAKIKNLAIEFHDFSGGPARHTGANLASYLREKGFRVGLRRSLTGTTGYLHCTRAVE